MEKGKRTVKSSQIEPSKKKTPRYFDPDLEDSQDSQGSQDLAPADSEEDLIIEATPPTSPEKTETLFPEESDDEGDGKQETKEVLKHFKDLPDKPSHSEKKFRHFRFVCNNPTKEHLNLLRSLESVYCVYGREIAPETGTPHLQGHISFKNQRYLKALRKTLKGFDVRVADFLTSSIEYCKKGGDWHETGKAPIDQKMKGMMEKKRWTEFLKYAQEGEIDRIDARIQITQMRNLEYINKKYQAKRKLEDTTEQMLWFHGPTGSGKSRFARERFPDCYLKMCNKWWDHYEREEIVLLEDFDKDHKVLVHHLKIWADRYPFMCESKCLVGKIRPKLIIVTSNWEPEDIWEDPKDLEPILRRFKKVRFPQEPELSSSQVEAFREPEFIEIPDVDIE